MADIPAAAIKRIITKHGGELRTSASAIELAVAAAEDYVGRLAQEASNSAQSDRRKTIMDADIKKAREVIG